MPERDDDPARSGPPGDTPSRGDAEGPGDDGLAALRDAAARKLEVPRPPGGFEDPQLAALNGVWRLLPQEPETEIELGAGWRRRLRDIGWRLLRPILERQQRFNTLLVRHLASNAGRTGEDREWASRAVGALDGHLESLAAVQSGLVDYLGHLSRSLRESTDDLKQITGTLDEDLKRTTGTLDEDLKRTTGKLHEDVKRTAGELHQDLRRTAGELHEDVKRTAGELHEDLRRTAGELHESVDALEETTEGLRQSVALATASAHGLKREIERLRHPSTTPPGAPRAAGPEAARDDRGPETAGAEAAHPEAGVTRADDTGADLAEAGGSAPPATAPAAPDHLDSYQYVCFEDVFRGASEEIAKRQRAYLPYFEGASDVLDVGCGRGEFLALLREDGITGRGVDTNAEAIEHCRERGLEATRGDALGYLRTLADESVGGLFSAQVVEHLEADYLMRMLADARRALRPGSRVVLETINPTSWTAFFSAYLRDVTHRQPLHPETLGYLLRASGFVDVTIVYRSPVPDAAKLRRAEVDPALAATPAGEAVCELSEALNQHAELLNGLIFAEQDYAAIARRP